ncbi:MAG: GAF domain-containing sensor histidine kinase [Nonlabens sp.]
MIIPEIGAGERKRIAAVQKYQLLDTMPEDSYDDITSIVATICDAPIALITLMDNDRNFFKSKLGVDFDESPRNLSFCGHAINSDEELMIVKDARLDERFIDNPIVKEFNIIFYAGASLIDKNGYKLGTLCVYDHEPRTLNDQQEHALKAMAKQVMVLFEQRYQNILLEKTTKELEERNSELKDFAGIVSHDLKAPLSNIIMITDLLKKTESDLMDKSLSYLKHLKESSASMSRYIDGMLSFYKSEEMVSAGYEEVSYIDLIEDVISMTVLDNSATVIYKPTEETTLITNPIAVEQILINLVTNAVKYGDKEKTVIEIYLETDDDMYHITIKDNGRGIEPEKIDSIFKLFYVASEQDRNGKKGTGIGLATVAKLLKHMEGRITVSSEIGKWTKFKVSIPIPEI